MNWSGVKSWFGSNGEVRTAKFALPASVVEIEAGFVAGVRFDGAGGRSVRRVSVREFAPAALQVSFNRQNVQGGEELKGAVRAVKAVIGDGGASAGMLLPDGALRTLILGFETLPDDRREAEALIRWRLVERLAAPAEEMLISYQELGRGPGGIELLVTAARTAVLDGYIACLGPGAAPPALILPSTVALLPLVASEGEGGDLIVHASPGWVSVVVLDHEKVYLWRSRPSTASRPGEMGAEIRRAAISVHDRHKLEIRRIWVSERPPAPTASSPDFPSLVDELEKAHPAEVRILEPREGQMKSLTDPEKAIFKRFGAPVSGLLSNRN